MKIPIEISARHIHLSKEDLIKLFGANYELKKKRDLSQPGQFVSEETVDFIGPRAEIENVRILGPCRDKTQVEISETDARNLGIDPPVRRSGDLSGSAGVKTIGPRGEITLDEGVIIALRHIHMDTKIADKLNIKNNDRVKVDVDGVRDLIFENVLVRVSDNYKLAMHIDTDEANAAGIDSDNHFGKIII